MEGKATKKEKFQFYNSLACVVKSLEGQYTVVDLRNESTVTGKIKEMDGFWNLQMEDVMFYSPKGIHESTSDTIHHTLLTCF